jgi:hypothetical protein
LTVCDVREFLVDSGFLICKADSDVFNVDCFSRIDLDSFSRLFFRLNECEIRLLVKLQSKTEFFRNSPMFRVLVEYSNVFSDRLELYGKSCDLLFCSASPTSIILHTKKDLSLNDTKQQYLDLLFFNPFLLFNRFDSFLFFCEAVIPTYQLFLLSRRLWFNVFSHQSLLSSVLIKWKSLETVKIIFFFFSLVAPASADPNLS